MKKIFLALIALSTMNAFAVCQNTDRVFKSESDDVGTTLKLTYICQAEGDEICLYSNNKVASVVGSVKEQYVSTAELYRRNYFSDRSSLQISAKTGLVESVFDYKSIEVELDKNTLKGMIRVEGKGFDPFSGSSSSTVKSKLSCKEI